MRDREHAPEARCSPEGLLQQILELSERHSVAVAGENALQRYDYEAFDRIIQSAFGQASAARRPVDGLRGIAGGVLDD